MKNYKLIFFYLLFSIFTINIYSQNVGINTINPKATLDVNGGAIFRGTNNNTLDSLQAGVEFFLGRSLNYDINADFKADIAFNWGGSGGGFRHFITTRHENLMGSENNAFDFFLNNTNLQYDSTTRRGYPSFSITAIGNKIYKNNFLEFGAGLYKDPNSGKIGYQLSSNGLDIFGAGVSSSSRRITLYGDRAINMLGNVGIGTTHIPVERLHVNGNVRITNNLLVSSITQESIQSPVLQNGWENHEENFENAGFWKDKEGLVHLQGLIRNGTITQSTVLFTLPAGYRPSKRLIFVVLNNNTVGRLDLLPNGEMIIANISSNLWLNLSGIYFRTN